MQPLSFDHISTHSLLDVSRYAAAVRAYVGVLMRPDDHAADEVAGEFMLEMQRGGLSLGYLRRPEPRGPFRRHVKLQAFRAARDFQRKRTRERARVVFVLDLAALPEETAALAEADAAWSDQADKADRTVRTRILDRAWLRLEEHHHQSQSGAMAVLAGLKKDHPAATRAELADLFASRTGREMATATLGVYLDRVRHRLARFILEEARPHIPPLWQHERIDRATAEEELKDLRLLGFFRELPEG